MNPQTFVEYMNEQMPPAKPLSTSQLWKMKERLAKYSEPELDRLAESVIDNCKFFPKIPDLLEQAKALGIPATISEYRPHTWEPTDCQRCAGSGRLAVFWSQEFEMDGDAKRQILRLHYILPYHESGKYARRNDHDDIRTAHRCDCPAGEMKTLERGLPRWKPDAQTVIRKGWVA